MLTDDERRELKAWRSRQAFAVFLLAFGIVPFTVWLTLSVVFSPAEFFSSVRLVLLPAVLFWGWLLHRTPWLWLRAGRDLAEGLVDQRRGVVQVRQRAGIGIIAPLREELRIAEKRFSLAPFWSDQITPGLGYRVRFAPHSGAILSISRETASAEAAPVMDPPLSPREAALARLLAEGLTDKDIARELNLSPTTVRTYNSELYARLGIQRRGQVRAIAEALGLLDD